MFYLPNSPLMRFLEIYFYYKVDYVETIECRLIFENRTH